MLFLRSIRGIRDIEKSGIDEDSFSEVRTISNRSIVSKNFIFPMSHLSQYRVKCRKRKISPRKEQKYNWPEYLQGQW